MPSMLKVRISGPLESYSDGFAVELSGLGYTRGSAAQQLRLLAHLSRWMADQGLEEGLAREHLVAFVAVRREAGFRVYRSLRGMAVVWSYLSACGVAVPAEAAGRPACPAEELVERYRGWLVGDRGVAASSARTYISAIRPFVTARETSDGLLDLAGLTADDVSGFLLDACSGDRVGKAKTTATALRSLLAFLYREGVVDASLAGAVPSVASWKLAALPRTLEADDVARLLVSCDRRTTLGRRDAAMLLLLARLGLRAAEVAGLGLDDLDWRAGEIAVVGKGDRRERLPLPDDVGRAVVSYLQRRPHSAQDRTVFVRVKAPHQRLTAEAVSERVCAAGKRAGLGEQVRAHRLRHATATRLLEAGAPLTEIGQLLRHRKALTTAIYAKVDRQALGTLVRRWPAGDA
jgi:integrase/recombinase XerD